MFMRLIKSYFTLITLITRENEKKILSIQRTNKEHIKQIQFRLLTKCSTKLKRIIKSASNKKRKDKIKKIEAEISRNWKEKVYELKLNRISIMQFEVSRKWYHNRVLYVIPIQFYTPPLTNLQRVAQDPLGQYTSQLWVTKSKAVNVKHGFVHCVTVLHYLWSLSLSYNDTCLIAVLPLAFYSCGENSIVHREVDLGIVFIRESRGFKNLPNFI